MTPASMAAPQPTSPTGERPAPPPHPSVEHLSQHVSRWPALALAILFAVMAVGAAILGVLGRTEEQSSRDWPTAPGTITRCELVEVRDRPRRLPYEIVRYQVDLAYDYSVDGELYEGRSVSLHGIDKWELPYAESQAEKYAVGTTHPVYYNPDDPDRAALEPGSPKQGSSLAMILGFWLPLGLALLAIVSFASFVAMHRHSRRLQQAH
ncbi:MAG: DUF3592 domain-containing protein [Pirellulaceae bacterium]|nr:DUF3592 domain-containing protein [Pirellulaceae bacterium]